MHIAFLSILAGVILYYAIKNLIVFFKQRRQYKDMITFSENVSDAFQPGLLAAMAAAQGFSDCSEDKSEAMRYPVAIMHLLALATSRVKDAKDVQLDINEDFMLDMLNGQKPHRLCIDIYYSESDDEDGLELCVDFEEETVSIYNKETETEYTAPIETFLSSFNTEKKTLISSSILEILQPEVFEELDPNEAEYEDTMEFYTFYHYVMGALLASKGLRDDGKKLSKTAKRQLQMFIEKYN